MVQNLHKDYDVLFYITGISPKWIYLLLNENDNIANFSLNYKYSEIAQLYFTILLKQN